MPTHAICIKLKPINYKLSLSSFLQVISAFIFWNLTPYTLAVNSASAGRKKGRLYSDLFI